MKAESTLMTNKQVTFSDFDKLNLKKFAENLFQIMEKGADSAIGDIGEKGSYTISLNAKFGNGKTTFLKMFEDFISTDKQSYDVLFINAWESDFYGEPVIAILSEFVHWLEQEENKTPKQINKTITKKINQPKQEQRTKTEHLSHQRRSCKGDSPSGQSEDPESPATKIKKVMGRLANHKITKALGSLAIHTAENRAVQIAGILVNQYIQNKTGYNLKDLFSNKNNVPTKQDPQNTDQNKSLGESVFKEFNDRKDLIQEIKTIISEYLSSSSQKSSSQRTQESKKKNKEKKLLIIVDELDRTRPDYAVHFLEDIKHFFDIQNVIFLVAVNKKQMEATVKCLYGQSLDFDGYYRKFFKHEINLPDPYKEAQRLIDDLLTQKTNVKYNAGNGPVRKSNSYLSCRMFNLTLREVEQFVRIFEMVLGDDQKIERWIYQDAYSFFICLYMKEKQVFQKILDGQFTIDDFVQFIDKKDFKYKWDMNKGIHISRPKVGVSTESTIPYDNHLLLGMTAYSFVPDLSDPKAMYRKIDHLFPMVKGTPGLDYREGYFDARHGQPAVKICEKINQCQSAFTG